MNFLHKQLRDLIETKAASALKQDDFIAQALEDLAMDKGFNALKEELLCYLYFVGIFTDHLSDANELHHTTLTRQVTDLVIEFRRLFSALEDVAKDECATTAFVVGPTVHEVERDIQRIDIGVIGVIDQCTSVAAFLHLQAHGDRLQLLHALSELLGRDTDMQCYSSADDGVRDRRVVDERNRIAAFLTTFIYIMNRCSRSSFLYLLDKHRSFAVFQRPTKPFTLIIELPCYFINYGVILVVDHRLRIMEKNQFLTAFFFHRREILLMRVAKVGQHGYSGLDDVAQR